MVRKKFNGKNLKNARLYRALTLTELANETGISKQSISLYENGRNFPDYEKICKISKCLNFPYDFFFQTNSLETVNDVTYFRSLTSATKLKRTSYSIKLDYVSKIYGALSKFIEFPKLNIPSIEFNISDYEPYEENEYITDQIEYSAKYLRNFWGIDDRPIPNLKYLLEKNGILVTSFDAEDNKIDAFSQRAIIENTDIYFIALALGNKSEGRVNFDLSHELGHILLHPWSENLELITKEDFKSREKQANMFASSFLLPKDSFSDDIKSHPTDLKYYKFLKNKWNVSIQAMLYRTNQLNIISNNQFQYLMKQISKNGWRTNEPEDYIYELKNNIFQESIDLLINENILSIDGILNLIKEHGIILHPDEIEILLNLKRKTLQSVSTITTNKIIKLNRKL